MKNTRFPSLVREQRTFCMRGGGGESTRGEPERPQAPAPAHPRGHQRQPSTNKSPGNAAARQHHPTPSHRRLPLKCLHGNQMEPGLPDPRAHELRVRRHDPAWVFGRQTKHQLTVLGDTALTAPTSKERITSRRGPCPHSTDTAQQLGSMPPGNDVHS